LAFCVAYALGATAIDMRLGQHVNAAAFPLAAAVFTAVPSVMLLVASRRARDLNPRARDLDRPADIGRTEVLFTAMGFVYWLSLPWLGYVVATSLFLLVGPSLGRRFAASVRRLDRHGGGPLGRVRFAARRAARPATRFRLTTVTGSLACCSGFAGALSLPNLASAFAGAVLGTVVGVLPGIGPSTTVALLIPIAFKMSPDTALIMMTAVYCGAMYGGSLTSVLLKVPGEASSVMTAIDGHEMAKQGRAGSALAISAIGSWIGGTFSVIGLMLLAPPLAEFALKFGPAEYFGVMAGALLFSLTLVGGSPARQPRSAGVGLMLSTVGTDLQTGVSRFTLGLPDLLDGIEILTLIVGVFGVGEVLWYFREARQQTLERLPLEGALWPSRQEFRDSAWPIARASVIGFVAGLLPGSGSTLASITAYFVEKRVSKHPERFGHGAIERRPPPETDNNAATGGRSSVAHARHSRVRHDGCAHGGTSRVRHPSGTAALHRAVCSRLDRDCFALRVPT
jgi:hypothetical protein